MPRNNVDRTNEDDPRAATARVPGNRAAGARVSEGHNLHSIGTTAGWLLPSISVVALPCVRRLQVMVGVWVAARPSPRSPSDMGSPTRLSTLAGSTCGVAGRFPHIPED